MPSFITRTTSMLCGAVALAAAPYSLAQQARQQLDVPYVPTPMPVVDAMLELGDVDSEDTLYDLGSGDGRIVIRAAERFGTEGTGIDLNPERIEEARAAAREADVEDKVEFVQGDLFETDFSDATVLTMYLLPSVNMKLRERILNQLEPGTRVVSHAFDMEDWEPDETRQVGGSTVYMWTVPADVAGDWQWQVEENGETREYQVSLQQSFQQVSGDALVDGQPAELTDVTLQGDRLSFAVVPPGSEQPTRFEATVDGEQLVGEAHPPQTESSIEWSATGPDNGRG